METLHTRVYNIGRSAKSKSRGSATAASAYVSGSVVAAAAYRSHERIIQNESGRVHDYTRKHGVAHSEIVLPENAPEKFADRATLWNEVEAVEKRKDAQLARQYQAALPAEFTREEQLKLVQDFIFDNFVNRGMIADFAIHDKGDGNPHFHCLLTTRHVTKDGFGLKNRDWNDYQRDSRKRGLYKQIRMDFAERCNRLYAEKGLPDRIDPRKYADQGKQIEPTMHRGKEADQLEKRGIKTEIGNRNREIQARNEARLQPDPMPLQVLYQAPPDEKEPEQPPQNITDQGQESPEFGYNGFIPESEFFEPVPGIAADGVKVAQTIEPAMAITAKTVIQPALEEVAAPHLDMAGAAAEQVISDFMPEEAATKQPTVNRHELQNEIRQLKGRSQNVGKIQTNISTLEGKIERLSIQLESAGFGQSRMIEGQLKDAKAARDQAIATLNTKYQLSPNEIIDYLHTLGEQIQSQQQIFDSLRVPEPPKQEKARGRTKTISRSR